MRSAKTISAAILSFALMSSPLQAAALGEAPAGVTGCALSAWLATPVGQGAAIHSEPSAESAVVGELPPTIQDDDVFTFGAEVSITGSKDGWFRIDRAEVIDYIGDEAPKTVFAGEGWVPGAVLGLLLNRSLLYAGPSIDSAIVAELTGVDTEGYGSGPDSFAVSRLDACVDHWVEVEGEFLGKQLRGWAAGTCSNQVTTCP